MVASTVSANRFAPDDRPRVAVASDGSLAAIHERTRVVIVELPSCVPFAQLAVDPAARDSEVVWVGTPPRLLVLARHGERTLAQLVDPIGPRTVAELALESAMKLGAAVGGHALVLGAQQGAAVLAATDRTLTSHWFPARALPTAAGAAGAQFIVALGGAIEEWEPQTRLPKRRLKLPQPAEITAIGGSQRVVWMTTRNRPSRIDVLPLVDRGQPKAHDLPEPIAHVASHPRSDLVVCVGATSRGVWVIDLEGRSGLRTIDLEDIDRVDAIGLVHGDSVGVLAAQTRRPIAVVPLDRAVDSPVLSAPPAALVPPRTQTLERYSDPIPSRAPTIANAPSFWADAAASWRDDLAAWARGVMAQGPVVAPPRSLPIDAMIARHELADDAYAAVALLYGAHLNGADGAAPIDVARVASWAEALGRGELTRVAYYADSRVRLGSAVTRALDELPPLTGALLGTPGPVSITGGVALVATGSIQALAEARLASVGGAILAGYDDIEPWDVLCEARAFGAVALLRVTVETFEQVQIGQPVIFVVDDEDTADVIGVPRL